MCACSHPLPGSPLAYASHQPAQNAIASRVAKSTSADFPDPDRVAGSRQSILAITSGLPTSARNLQDEGTEASLPHLYELQGGRRSYRLQDARKTRRISQRIKFVILMDEQQPSIVLLQSILQQSHRFFMIAQHSVDASQIHGRNITPLLFRFQAAQNQESFFPLAAFDECPSQVCLSFQRFACEAHALFVCGNRLLNRFRMASRQREVMRVGVMGFLIRGL